MMIRSLRFILYLMAFFLPSLAAALTIDGLIKADEIQSRNIIVGQGELSYQLPYVTNPSPSQFTQFRTFLLADQSTGTWQASIVASQLFFGSMNLTNQVNNLPSYSFSLGADQATCNQALAEPGVTTSLQNQLLYPELCQPNFIDNNQNIGRTLWVACQSNGTNAGLQGYYATFLDNTVVSVSNTLEAIVDNGAVKTISSYTSEAWVCYPEQSNNYVITVGN